MLSLNYDHEEFPPSTLSNLDRRIQFTWDDFLWAALTVGRPSINFVFAYGEASVFEAVFRLGMIRMALQQTSGFYPKLERSAVFRTMDPSEKGAVNYFLALVVCKLFSWKKLNAPWTIHLDVWRQGLAPQYSGGRARPDMVAQSATSGDWYSFESKGRVGKPGSSEKRNAKRQAERLLSVMGTPCSLHVAAITYYENNALTFYCRDPVPTSEPIELKEVPGVWGAYYGFAAH
jgi:hypothetical protein